MATANHVLLRRITVTDPVSSITFSSIPQTGYTDLKIVVSARTSEAQSIGPAVLQFNGVTTSYSSKEVYGAGSGSAGAATRGVLNSGMYLGNGVGGIATANTFGNMEIYIPNYTSANYKSVNVDNVGEDNATTAYATMVAGLWSNTAAITSVALYPYSGSTNWVVGSSFSLYGVADVNTIPLTAPKADGGDIIKTDGTYWYHTFLSAGIFKPQVNLTCDYLVVAGGGGGGSDNNGNGGGGGAGGYLTSTTSFSSSPFTVTVGAGGPGGVAYPDVTGKGIKGSNSALSTIISYGGGGGENDRTGTSTSSGGSGGGGASTAHPAGTATPSGQGNNGGTTSDGTLAGGGGGAGAAGGNSSGAYPTGSAGNGGAGLSSSISGSSVTYAGGGGGSAYISGQTRGTGGSGGGGNGSNYNASVGNTAGTAYTGGGGGGGSGYGGSGYSGANGGSGIVIIRYAV